MAKLNSKKTKKSSFYEEKSLVGLTHGFQRQTQNTFQGLKLRLGYMYCLTPNNNTNQTAVKQNVIVSVNSKV